MATVAVGDIHGNLAALLDLLGQLRDEVAEGDVMVFLGDYIDRGPDSRGCVEAILTFRDESRAEVVCLRGNHEDWLLRTQQDYTRHSWLLGMEALDTVRSYSPEAERTLREALREAGLRLYLGHCDLPYDVFFDTVPPSHRAFFAQLALSFHSDDCICTHAGLDPRVTTLADQTLESLVWGNAAFPADYRGGPTVVYGHGNNADLDADGWPIPRIVGNTIGIDTISHGVLTAIRMPDRHVFQSVRHATTCLTARWSRRRRGSMRAAAHREDVRRTDRWRHEATRGSQKKSSRPSSTRTATCARTLCGSISSCSPTRVPKPFCIRPGWNRSCGARSHHWC